uniref:Uncharacterized protein n=1 Tax=Timema monikensis TaxID=170555 RepID=A0A7R9E9U4_9NEOP|nr:unnamed protein product [Timema monikensis]
MSAARRLVSSSCLEAVHELASRLGIDREASEDLTKSVSHLGKVQQNLLRYNASISSYIKELKDARNVTLALSDEKTSTN